MATRTVKTCDVFGTSRGVASFRLALYPLTEDGEIDDEPIFEWEGDLSDRALGRLTKFLNRGTRKPSSPVEADRAES